MLNASGTVQHCLPLPTSEVEYVAMVQGGEGRVVHKGHARLLTAKAFELFKDNPRGNHDGRKSNQRGVGVAH